MKIKFKINYKTEYGQLLKIVGSEECLGKFDLSKSKEMYPIDGNSGWWDCIIETNKNIKKIQYKYAVEDKRFENIHFLEYGENRTIDISNINKNQIEILDFWRPTIEPRNSFETSAFKNIIFKYTPENNNFELNFNKSKISIFFSLYNLRIQQGQQIAIIGNIEELGNNKKPIILNDFFYPYWKINIDLKKNVSEIRYKYLIIDKKTNKIIEQENKERELTIDNNSETDLYIINDQFFDYTTDWKGSGVAIPVFSLRTKEDHGVGEFLDLKKFVDWAKKVGLKMIQILPINDTVSTHTWKDSYPYKAISVFALHPIYLNLGSIGNLSAKITQEIIEQQKQLLNENSQVDYEAVMKIKSRFYKMIYDEQKNTFLSSKEFKEFYQNNKYWLVPYAAFSYLRDLFGTADYSKWGKYSKPTQELFEALDNSTSDHYHDIAIHYFIQYHLHKQLLEAANYAREQGIVLKGDIPIGISKQSVDAWMYPQLFNMQVQAGAPPDDFSDEGQNWGFPTYNWEEMKKDNYKWWQMRMQKMSEYFDAFRIDHILGFFRIWEIPNDQLLGLMGYFNPSIPIYTNEFYYRGISFDFYRYSTPYIREYMLDSIFGNSKDYIKRHFLVEYEPYKYYLKPEFEKQINVSKFLNISDSDTPEQRQFKEFIQKGIFKLISERLFLKYPYSTEETYIPRHSLYKTNSFAALDENQKRAIMDIYEDYYFRRNENYWHTIGYEKLQIIKQSTNMLICGEDLGMIPACVPQVMKDLNILSLEIQRMPKDSNKEFTHPNDYPYLSVATPSSHDTSTIRGWWEEDSARSQRFFNQILGKQGGSPYFCEPWIVKDIINQHLYCPSMWVVFPIQDLLGMDGKLRYTDAKAERINEPANPNHYWRYRIHLNIEDLLEENEFNSIISNMLKESKRA